MKTKSQRTLLDTLYLSRWHVDVWDLGNRSSKSRVFSMVVGGVRRSKVSFLDLFITNALCILWTNSRPLNLIPNSQARWSRGLWKGHLGAKNHTMNSYPANFFFLPCKIKLNQPQFGGCGNGGRVWLESWPFGNASGLWEQSDYEGCIKNNSTILTYFRIGLLFLAHTVASHFWSFIVKPSFIGILCKVSANTVLKTCGSWYILRAVKETDKRWYVLIWRELQDIYYWVKTANDKKKNRVAAKKGQQTDTVFWISSVEENLTLVRSTQFSVVWAGHFSELPCVTLFLDFLLSLFPYSFLSPVVNLLNIYVYPLYISCKTCYCFTCFFFWGEIHIT